MESHFHGYKIRYELLNQQFLPIRASNKIKTINIFISLDDFYHSLYRPFTDEEFKCCGANVYKQIVSNIINIIGHYKHWAIKEGLSPNIFLVYTSSNVFKNGITQYPDYRARYNELAHPKFTKYFHINDTIRHVNPLIGVVIKYISNCYIIDSKYIEPSVVPLYLSELRPADWNFIISRDLYDLQYSYISRFTFISPKGDNSRLVSGRNIWDYVFMKERITNIDSSNLNPETFIYVKSIIGDKYRSIPKLARAGWKTVLNYILKECDSDASLLSQQESIGRFIDSKKISLSNFNKNLEMTDVRIQEKVLLESDKLFILNQLTDMEDRDALQDINKQILSDFPINMQFVLQNTPNVNNTNAQYFWKRG